MTQGWHVLGAGAVGCLFASRLHKPGSPVTLLLRERERAAIAGATTRIRIQDAEHEGTLELPISACAEPAPIARLLVTTKAYDVRAAVASVAHRLQPAAPVLLLVNGMGFAEELRVELPRLDYYFGTTTAGAFRRSRWHLQLAGTGNTRIGQPGRNAAAPWFGQWREAVANCQWDANIEAALWLKLAINCAINPLAALNRCTNGELARNPRLASRVDALCEEIHRISSAAGREALTEGLHAAVTKVLADTAANRCSMLQDVLAGRPTEIAYLNGFLVAEAERCGEPAPLNRQLLKAIAALPR